MDTQTYIATKERRVKRIDPTSKVLIENEFFTKECKDIIFDEIKKSSMIIVTGPVAGGKTTLLNCLLNEGYNFCDKISIAQKFDELYPFDGDNIKMFSILNGYNPDYLGQYEKFCKEALSNDIDVFMISEVTGEEINVIAKINYLSLCKTAFTFCGLNAPEENINELIKLTNNKYGKYELLCGGQTQIFVEDFKVKNITHISMDSVDSKPEYTILYH